MITQKLAWCGLLIGAAALSGCFDVEDPEYREHEESIVFSTGYWESIWNHRNRSTSADPFVLPAQYGTAVGAVPGCTAFFIDERTLVTAEHCTSASNTVVAMGLWQDAPGWNSFAEQRLREMGFHEGAVNALAWWEKSRFNCTQISPPGGIEMGVDIRVYECDPNPVVLNGHWVDLYPGDIWGYVKTRTHDPLPEDPDYPYQMLSRGDGIYDLHVNTMFKNGPVLNLLSVGTVDFPWQGSGWRFLTDNDNTRVGSSGGAVLEAATLELTGVIRGGKHYDEDFDNASYSEPQGDFNNSSTYVPYNFAQRYRTDYVYGIPKTSARPARAFTQRVGGDGGKKQDLHCVPRTNSAGGVHDYVASGIVGTTVADWPNLNPRHRGSVGNLGVVCAPMVDFATLAERRRYYPVVSTVSHGGSVDTFFPSTPLNPVDAAGNYDYNAYIHEVLSYSSPAQQASNARRQTTALCPAGSYLHL